MRAAALLGEPDAGGGMAVLLRRGVAAWWRILPARAHAAIPAGTGSTAPSATTTDRRALVGFLAGMVYGIL